MAIFYPFPISFDGSASKQTTTKIGATVWATQLLAANANRVSATIYNESQDTLFIDFGDAVSELNFTVKIGPEGYYEIPSHIKMKVMGLWKARISGATPAGSAHVREFNI